MGAGPASRERCGWFSCFIDSGLHIASCNKNLRLQLMSNASKARDPQACAHFKDLFGGKFSSGEDASAVPQCKILEHSLGLDVSMRTLEAGAKALEPGHRLESFSISPGITICF